MDPQYLVGGGGGRPRLNLTRHDVTPISQATADASEYFNKPERLRTLPEGQIEVLPEAMHNAMFCYEGAKSRLLYGTVVRMGTNGTGSCFYNSEMACLNVHGFLSKSLHGRAALGEGMRCAMTRTMERFRASFNKRLSHVAGRLEKSMDDLVGEMCEPNVWANAPLIMYATFEMGINVIVYDHLGKPYCDFDPAQFKNRFTIVILWVNDHKHFEPLLFLNHHCGTGHSHYVGVLDNQCDQHKAILADLHHFYQAADVCE